MDLKRFVPVVTAQEMVRLERLAIQAGASEESFMEEAGKKIALFLLEKGVRRVALLVGKGNNGGDALAAGVFLLEKGVRVRALTLYSSSESSPLNRKFRILFQKKKGVVSPLLTASMDEEWILDGLLGTGFSGKLAPEMISAIQRANESGRPILAIDIPSGLDGTTGAVRGGAISATETIALGFPKSGFFLREGWNRVGKIRVVDFGLPEKISHQVERFAQMAELKHFASFLPPIQRNRHKYQAGYVVGLGGSSLFRGAPKLVALAALRSGAGIVRIFHREEIGEIPLELIAQKWSSSLWAQEVKRASSLFIGPGFGSSLECLRLLKKVIKEVSIPSVIDADALQPGFHYPKGSILTPHRGELLRLLGLSQDGMEEDLLARCQKWVDRKEVALVLKGAPTFIFGKNHTPVIIPFGDPGMATAGAGDVLTGVLAALLAQKMNGFDAAVLGAALHGLGGEIAAEKKSSYGMIATDIIEQIPEVFLKVCV